MNRRFVAAVVTAALLQLAGVKSAQAGPSQPPPPPPPPGCKYCPGPPPPPTPVPTLPPTVSPAAVSVAVHMSPAHVRRGHAAKVTVEGASDDAVAIVVQYHGRKPVTYHGKIDAAGAFTRSWTVPKSAPLGKAVLTVTVTSSVNPFNGSFSFVVVK